PTWNRGRGGSWSNGAGRGNGNPEHGREAGGNYKPGGTDGDRSWASGGRQASPPPSQQIRVPPPPPRSQDKNLQPTTGGRAVHFNGHLGSEEVAQYANHGSGKEPMDYRWSRGGGRGRGEQVYRGGRGGYAPWNERSSRGGGATSNSGNHNSVTQAAPGATSRWPASQDEAAKNGLDEQLPRGKWWHDSSDPACFCRTPDCGEKQLIPYCQGCNQHHHERASCYKQNDERFNSTGYWCVNRKGQGPIPSLSGTYPGSPRSGRQNHMGGGEEGVRNSQAANSA
ncbi:hypothetical protein C9890_0200, partial [Perkinsus sp. BL_2016]